mgnify:CR=1 FL=1
MLMNMSDSLLDMFPTNGYHSIRALSAIRVKKSIK